MKFIFACLLALTPLAHLTAQTVPSLVNYQGRLLDAGGDPRSGNVSIALSVHTADTGGTQMYEETINPVAVNNGLFSLQFGGQPGFAAALANPEAWLEVRVDGSLVGLRSRLVAVPYAISAGSLGSVLADVPGSPAPGAIRWTGASFEGFNGSHWVAFGQNPPLVNIAMVTVGNPGNSADPLLNGIGGHSGAVTYEYKISQNEITNAEYVTFLNAVDPNGLNALDLYNGNMDSDISNGGITLGAGNADGGKYAVKAGFASKPVVYVTFYDAMRFCNWLHNGALAGGDTENGAYSLLGNSGTPSNGATVTRNAGAKFAVPSEDEWYKAAYHQPAAQGGDIDNYWLYPTMSNSEPSASIPPGFSPSANQNYSVGSVTDVGAYTTTVGFYGTFDMAGNVYEWVDTIWSASRLLRGGAWNFQESKMRSDGPASWIPAGSNPDLGFRVSSP